jgi:hypothetical protein
MLPQFSPDGAEFRGRVAFDGRHETLRVARGDLRRLADHLDERFGPAGGATVEERLTAAIARDELLESTERLSVHCRRAGVRHALVSGRDLPRTYLPLWPAGHAFDIEIGPARDVSFLDDDGSGAAWSYLIVACHSAVPDLVGHFASLAGLRPPPAPGLDPEDDLVHYIRELVRTGELAAGLDTEVARDRVAAHFAAAGVTARPGSARRFGPR